MPVQYVVTISGWGYLSFAFSHQAIYSAFGGGSKGMVYRDLVCGLALLVHGTPQEKAKCMVVYLTVRVHSGVTIYSTNLNWM